jgi:hypothetical protein
MYASRCPSVDAPQAAKAARANGIASTVPSWRAAANRCFDMLIPGVFAGSGMQSCGSRPENRLQPKY